MPQKGLCPFWTSPQTAVFDPREACWRLRLVKLPRLRLLGRCGQSTTKRLRRPYGTTGASRSGTPQAGPPAFLVDSPTLKSKSTAHFPIGKCLNLSPLLCNVYFVHSCGARERQQEYILAVRPDEPAFSLLPRLDAATYGTSPTFVGCALHYAGRFVTFAWSRRATPDNPLCGLRFPHAATAMQCGYLDPALRIPDPFLFCDQVGNPPGILRYGCS